MSKPKLKLSIAHQVPGRVRMKIPSAKGNTELLQQISETFAVIPGIEQVTVNPVTGSVVLHYDVERHDEFHGRFRDHHGHVQSAPPPTQIDEFANKIEEEAEFLARNSESARAVVDFCKKLDQEIKKATGNSVDLKIVFAIAIIGVTVFEIGATAATPVWARSSRSIISSRCTRPACPTRQRWRRSSSRVQVQWRPTPEPSGQQRRCG